MFVCVLKPAKLYRLAWNQKDIILSNNFGRLLSAGFTWKV